MLLRCLSFTTWSLIWSFLFLCWYIFQHYYRKYKNYPPGPVPWPLVGNVLQIDQRHMYKSFQEWSKHYGTKLMSVKLGLQKAVIINDPYRAKEMYGDFTFSGRPQAYFLQVLSGGSYGILVSEGKEWEQQRRFTLRHLRNFGFGKNIMETLIMDSAQEMLEWIKKQNGQPLQDLQRTLSLAVLSSLWTIVSGQKLSQDDPELTSLLEALQEGGSAITKSPLLVVAPWIRHFLPRISGYTKFRAVVDKMHKFIRDTIGEHKNDLRKFNDDHSSPKDFIEAYLREMIKTKDPSSTFYADVGERHLMAVVGDLFQGGSETTGITLTWAILFLMTHPEDQKRLQTEIDQIVGHSRLPQLYDRLRMPYTEAVILETSRMASVIPLGVFHSSMADAYFHDYLIPKGRWIWINQYAIHMDDHYWGNPEEFKPERFLSKNGESVVRTHENYLPFSVGKRECPGKSLATDTLFLFISSIFQRFTAVPASGFPIPDILDSEDGFFRAPKKFSVVMKKRATALNTPITITVT